MSGKALFLGAMVRRFLFPRYEDEFPAFRAEVERLSVLGLRVIAAVCLGAPLVSVLLTVLLLPSAPELSMIVPDLSETAIGALILYLSFQKWISPYARGFGVSTSSASTSSSSWRRSSTARASSSRRCPSPSCRAAPSRSAPCSPICSATPPPPSTRTGASKFRAPALTTRSSSRSKTTAAASRPRSCPPYSSPPFASTGDGWRRRTGAFSSRADSDRDGDPRSQLEPLPRPYL